MVQPFMGRHGDRFRRKKGPQPDAYALYLWATAVVGAYSFELGDDLFQVLL